MANTESNAVADFSDFMRNAATLPGILTAAADDLKADNDAAERDDTDRCYDQLRAWMLMKGMGAANLIALAAQVAEEIAIDRPDVSDWRTAQAALEVAAKAVDLPYAEDHEPSPCAVDASRAAIKAGRGTPGDYELIRRTA